LKIKLNIASTQLNLRILGGSVVEQKNALYSIAALLDGSPNIQQDDIPPLDIGVTEGGSEIIFTSGDVEDFSVVKEPSMIGNQDRPTSGRKPPRGSSRMFSGKPVYKCGYSCPECGKKGTRFVWAGSYYVKCHGCSTHIHVKKAVSGVDVDTAKVPIQTDAAGNFFVATELFESKQVRELNKQLLETWDALENRSK
jgi:hypothetical protein